MSLREAHPEVLATGGAGPGGARSTVPGAEDVGFAPVEAAPELLERRAAVAELGAELRALVDLATRTEVPAEVLRETAQRLRDIPPALRARTRKVTEPASVDDLAGGVRMLNPVIGAVYAHGGVNAMLLDQVLGHAAGPDRRGRCPASPAQRSRPAR